MNKEEPYREQAERLKQRIQKINDHIDENVETTDLLPPREQIHREKKQKMKWKLKYPVIRLLALFFILLPVIIFSVISYSDGKKTKGSEKTSGDSIGYETINLDDSKKEEQPSEDGLSENKEEGGATTLGDDNSAPQSEVVQPALEGEASIETTTPAPAPNPDSNGGGSDPASADKITQPAAPAKKQPNTGAKTGKIVYHTVQPKETLFRIAMKYYNSQAGVDIIRKANRIQGDQIYAGQVLKIPLNN